MAETRRSLRALVALWIAVAFLVGVIAAGLWSASQAAWQAHLLRSQAAGQALYGALVGSGTLPEGITVTRLPLDQARILSTQGAAQLPDAPQPAYVTSVSIREDSPAGFSNPTLSLIVLSGELQYRVADIPAEIRRGSEATLGAVTRLLATYCSDAVVYARPYDSAWVRVDGLAYWGCDAAPPDWRLTAALLAALALGALFTIASNVAGAFSSFSQALAQRRGLSAPLGYSASGPAELAQIVTAVNATLEEERNRLAKRASILSGVSHDLGTPATRLRLRTALIEDADLRRKLEADIDQMTGIIDSVLTYTRSELGSEEAREISLTALVQAVVSDFEDMGKPVEMHAPAPTEMGVAGTIFGSGSGLRRLEEDRHILIRARPLALRRALSNLIDNALKYGRRAAVSIHATPDEATIRVEDEGRAVSPPEMDELLAPFRRGANTGQTEGHGLGLTIVSTIAEQHGGRLSYEQGPQGLCAVLRLQRAL